MYLNISEIIKRNAKHKLLNVSIFALFEEL